MKGDDREQTGRRARSLHPSGGLPLLASSTISLPALPAPAIICTRPHAQRPPETGANPCGVHPLSSQSQPSHYLHPCSYPPPSPSQPPSLRPPPLPRPLTTPSKSPTNPTSPSQALHSGSSTASA